MNWLDPASCARCAGPRPIASTRVWLSLGSAAIAEIAAREAASVVVIDMQHGLWERAALEAAVGLARLAAPVMVRVADGSPRRDSRSARRGRRGRARAAGRDARSRPPRSSRAARFPPRGRALGRRRPAARDFAAYVERGERAATVVGVMIETRAGLETGERDRRRSPASISSSSASAISRCRSASFRRLDAAHAEACAAILAACAARGIALRRLHRLGRGGAAAARGGLSLRRDGERHRRRAQAAFAERRERLRGRSG